MDLDLVQSGQQFTRVTDGIPADRILPGFGFGFGFERQDVDRQVPGDLDVTTVVGRDVGGSDDLGVRIDRDMTSAAVQASGVGLVSVSATRPWR